MFETSDRNGPKTHLPRQSRGRQLQKRQEGEE